MRRSPDHSYRLSSVREFRGVDLRPNRQVNRRAFGFGIAGNEVPWRVLPGVPQSQDRRSVFLLPAPAPLRRKESGRVITVRANSNESSGCSLAIQFLDERENFLRPNVRGYRSDVFESNRAAFIDDISLRRAIDPVIDRDTPV